MISIVHLCLDDSHMLLEKAITGGVNRIGSGRYDYELLI